MARPQIWKFTYYIIIISLVVLSSEIRAHLMPAQTGTLNFANGGAFLALSTSVSRFLAADDDDDGQLSPEELARHLKSIKQTIHQNVQLLNEADETLALRGLLISPVHTDEQTKDKINQILILGRYPMSGEIGSMGLRVTLLGQGTEENTITVMVTRGGISQKIIFSHDNEYHPLFPQTP